MLFEGVDDLLGDDLAHRRLLEHVGRGVGEPRELANVRQLHTDTIARFVSIRPRRMSAQVLRPSRPDRPPPSSPTGRSYAAARTRRVSGVRP